MNFALVFDGVGQAAGFRVDGISGSALPWPMMKRAPTNGTAAPSRVSEKILHARIDLLEEALHASRIFVDQQLVDIFPRGVNCPTEKVTFAAAFICSFLNISRRTFRSLSFST